MAPAKKRAVKGKEKEKVPTPKQEKDGAVKGKEKEKVATPKREKDGASPVPGKPDKRHRSNTNRILGIMEADSTSEEKLQMLDPLGFRGVSRVKLTRLPDNFIEWLCKSFDVSSRSFPLLRSGKFRIGEADVERVYGLPRGPYAVQLDMFSAAQRHRWGIELGLSNTKKGKASLANVKLALEEERDNKKWRDLFVLYAMEAVLRPSGNLKINLAYAGFLQDEMVADFTQYNWCKHVADHFNDSMVEVVQSISKFPGDVHLLFISILDRVKNPPELPIPTCKHRSYKVASAAFQALMDEGHLNIGHRDVVMEEEATSSQPMGRERVLGSKRKRPVDDLDMVREGDLPKLPHLDLNLDGVHSVEEAYQLKNDMESYKRALLRMAAHYSSSIEQVDDHIKMLEGQQPEDSPEDNVDFTDRVDDVSVAKGTNDVGRNASAANADDETGANSPKSPGLDDLSMEMDKDGAGSVDVVLPDVGHNDPAGTANDDTSPKGVLDSEGLDDHLDNLTMEMTQKSVDSENAKKVMEMDSCEEKGQGDDGDDNVDGVDAAKLDNLVEKVVKSAMGDVCEDVVVDEKRKEADAGEVLEGGDGSGDLTLSQLVREGKKKFKVKNAGSSSGVDIDVLKGAVLRYARDSNNLKEILFSRVDGFDCLYRKDTETLAHGKCVSVDVIDCYAAYLNREQVRRGQLKRWVFYSGLAQRVQGIVKNEGPLPNFFEETDEIITSCKWIPDGLDFSQCDYWMFPHCSDDHYRMYVVNLKNKRYDYLDSLYPDDLDSKFRAVADMVVRYATEYIPACRKEPFKFEEFKWVRQRGVRQRGGIDCGVFTMNFAEFWDGKLHPAMRNWQRQINQRRDEITLTLLLNKENSVLEEVKKKSLEFDRKVD